jgi:hypothetical protein
MCKGELERAPVESQMGMGYTEVSHLTAPRTVAATAKRRYVKKDEKRDDESQDSASASPPPSTNYFETLQSDNKTNIWNSLKFELEVILKWIEQQEAAPTSAEKIKVFDFKQLRYIFCKEWEYTIRREVYSPIVDIATAITIGNLKVPKKTCGKMSPADFEMMVRMLVNNTAKVTDNNKFDEMVRSTFAYFTDKATASLEGPGPPIFRNPTLVTNSTAFKSAKDLSDASQDGWDPEAAYYYVFDKGDFTVKGEFPDTGTANDKAWDVVNAVVDCVNWLNMKALDTWTRCKTQADCDAFLDQIKKWTPRLLKRAAQLSNGVLDRQNKPHRPEVAKFNRANVFVDPDTTRAFLLECFGLLKQVDAQVGEGKSLEQEQFDVFLKKMEAVFTKFKLDFAAAKSAAWAYTPPDSLNSSVNTEAIKKDATENWTKSQGFFLPTWALVVMVGGGGLVFLALVAWFLAFRKRAV